MRHVTPLGARVQPTLSTCPRRSARTSVLEVFPFLTTTPNAPVSTINHERMPVILTREEQFETWLNGSTDEALALSRQYPPGKMRIVREGLEKSDQLRAA